MSQPYEIAPVTLAKLDACWELRLYALREHPDAFGQPYEEAARLSPSQVRDVFDTWWTGGDNQVFIAVGLEGDVAGMSGIAREPLPTERHRANVWGMYVAPDARSRGLAGLLLDATIAWCRSLDGVLQIHLEAVSTNQAAIRLYRNAGFIDSGMTPRSRIVNGQALDHLQMVLVLDEYQWDSKHIMEGSTS